MRISDWSSDVCSSDLQRRCAGRGAEVLGPAYPGGQRQPVNRAENELRINRLAGVRAVANGEGSDRTSKGHQHILQCVEHYAGRRVDRKIVGTGTGVAGV